MNIFYTEFENEISSYKVVIFKTISKAKYQQLLDEKYEGFIKVKQRPINVMVAVPHECCICGKDFYNRAANMLRSAVERRQHHCLGKKSEEMA